MDATLIISIFGVGIFVGLLLRANNKRAEVATMRKPDADDTAKIMKLLETKQKITNNDVEKLLHVSDATAERYLNRLEQAGKLTQHGNTGRGTYYTKK